jgi:Tfp pilus assembly protein FimT
MRNVPRCIRRQQITLIELLIVLAVLSIVIGLIGFNVRNLIFEQRFKNEVKLVVDQLRMAQNLMLITGSNVHVKFRQGDGEIIMELESSHEIPWLKDAHAATKRLSVIRHVGFEEKDKEFSSGLEEPGVADVQFLSRGTVMTEGKLLVETQKGSENSLARFICLSGSPGPITVRTKEDSDCPKKIADEFKERLIRVTEQEIQEVGIDVEKKK